MPQLQTAPIQEKDKSPGPAPALLSQTVTSELTRLVHQSSHYLAGLIGGLSLGFISFPIFTRMFTMADYGLIDLTQKILLVACAISKLGLQNSVLRFYDGKAFATDLNAKQRYYSTMFFGVLLAGSAVTLLFALTAILLPKSLVGAPLAAILSFTSLLILLRGIQSILWSFMRIEERTKAYNTYGIVIKAGTIAAVLVLLPVLGPSIRTYFSGAMAVELLVVAALCAPMFRTGLLRASSFDSTLLRMGCAFGVPLVLQELSGLILDSGDRAMVAHYLGAAPLGFYSVSYGLATQLNTLLIVPLGLAILPIYMRLWTTEGRAKTIEFLSLGFDLFLAGAVALVLLAAVGSHDAVILLASSKYRGADRLIPTLIAGLLFWTAQIFLNAGLIIHKKTPTMAIALAVSAALNIALNVWLLPWIGLPGAAIATLVSYAFCTILLGYLSARVLPLRLEIRAFGGYLIAAAVAWMAASRIEFPLPVLNVVIKCATASALYLATLYLIDARVRTLSARLWRMLKERGQVETGAAAV